MDRHSIFLGLYIVSAVCLWILISAIILNFYFSKKGVVKKQKKSVVETGSMFGFFVVMVLLVYAKIGTLKLSQTMSVILAIFGTVLIIVGTVINIFGRLALKDNWGNQIRIYQTHTLTQTGIYRFIRHPLYSSTILMMYGFSLLFCNYLVFILNSVVFIPFMIYRAKQEEVLLFGAFGEEYKKYQKSTGMLLPKIGKGW